MSKSYSNVADNNDDDDDDDIIIEKFVGGKLGKKVKVGKTRMSKGFYQYDTWKNKNKERKRTYFREWEHW